MNAGCIPTKALVRVAELIHLARRDNRHVGFQAAGVTVDFPRVIARKREVVSDVVGRLTGSLTSTDGIELVRGTARFTDSKTVEVNGCTLTAPAVILATGSQPVAPSIPGAGEAGYLTSESIMELDNLPRQLVVIGAGPIGMEFAQMFSRFGSSVTVLFKGDRVLPHEDPDIGSTLTAYLAKEGLHMISHASVLRIERSASNADAARVVVAEVDGVERRFTADEVLLAIGRGPSADWAGLAAAGVATDSSGWIEVDSTLRTNVPGVFAIGDAIGHEAGSQLYTHVAVNQGAIAARNALKNEHEQFLTHALPGAVFTEPEVARVGLTEREAREAGYDPVSSTYPYAKVGRARAMGETEGFFKAVADRKTGTILGFHIFGASAGELVHIAATAMATESRSAQPILDAIFIHPTLAEGVQSVFEELLTALPARMAH
ncbi:MAG: FAD-containing oxidoreductase [Gemmatimonadaceae bacterium]